MVGRDLRAVTVAALYVDPTGVYANLPDVEVWDEARDARLYAGPWPVVAHPPCNRWSVLAGMIETRFGYKRGDDGGCFEAALAAVHEWGGVIEHPAYSAAWRHFGLPIPARGGGWVRNLFLPGWSIQVDQGWFGHAFKKPTWIYAVNVPLPELPRGPGPGREHPHRGCQLGHRRRQKLTLPTPPAFADLLVSMAREVCVSP